MLKALGEVFELRQVLFYFKIINTHTYSKVMKAQTHIKKLMLAFAGILTIALFFSSCDKNDNEELSGTSRIQVIHSAQGTGSVDLFVNDVKLNTSAVAYSQSSGYLQTSTGNKTAQIRLAGSSQVVSSTNINFENGKNYTIYVTGSGSSSGSVVTRDDTAAPSGDQAKVRFVNLSGLLGTASVMLDNASTVSNSLAVGSATEFQAISAGAHTVKVSSAANASMNNTSSFTFQPGKVYTVYITGTTSLSLNATVNN